MVIIPYIGILWIDDILKKRKIKIKIMYKYKIKFYILEKY